MSFGDEHSEPHDFTPEGFSVQLPRAEWDELLALAVRWGVSPAIAIRSCIQTIASAVRQSERPDHNQSAANAAGDD